MRWVAWVPRLAVAAASARVLLHQSSFLADLNGPDIYPQGFDCSHPETWGSGLSLQIDHAEQNTRFDAPLTPELVPEFQGGSFDPWGGARGCA